MRTSDRKVWYLRRLNLFAGMSREEIAGRLHERVCRRRETMIDPHGSADRIILIKSGSLRVFHLSPEGRELTTAILRPGQLLGTSALIWCWRAKPVCRGDRRLLHMRSNGRRVHGDNVRPPYTLRQGGQMPSHITHEELAKLISATRETVSKTLGQFADQGALELGYRRIVILDEQQLRQQADH